MTVSLFIALAGITVLALFENPFIFLIYPFLYYVWDEFSDLKDKVDFLAEKVKKMDGKDDDE